MVQNAHLRLWPAFGFKKLSYYRSFTNSYVKVTGCLSVSVCLKLRISFTTWPIWFSFTVKLLVGSERFILILGEGTNTLPNENVPPRPLPKKGKKLLFLTKPEIKSGGPLFLPWVPLDASRGIAAGEKHTKKGPFKSIL